MPFFGMLDGKGGNEMVIPSPSGRSYLSFQVAAIMRMASQPATLLGDPVGAGKTVMVAGLINVTEPDKIIIVCPASLKINWQRELERWLVRKRRIEILSSSQPNGWSPAPSGIYIINYDILSRWPSLTQVAWDLVVADEAHYCTNGKAKRTRALHGLRGGRRILLTATPFANRPVELFPLLKYLSPQRWNNWHDYVTRYCGGHKVMIRVRGGGQRSVWKVDGASNLQELGRLLRATVLIRRKKEEILPELPPIVRQVIELPVGERQSIVERENQVHEQWEAARARLTELEAIGEQRDDSSYLDEVARLRDLVRVRFTELAALRHETAVAKLPDVIEHSHILLAQEPKIIIFAHHLDIIDQLAEAMRPYGVVTLTGRDSATAKQRAVDAFQENRDVRVFIGQIRAAGVGLTLTASSTVVFAEMDWTDTAIEQAAGRAHRIGQTRSVLVQHLVLDGSIDAKMARKTAEKGLIATAVLDQ